MIRLHHAAFSGLWRQDDMGSDCLAAARRLVADRIRRARRRGQPVTTLKRGARWELGEPENCALIPDSAGILSMREWFRFECRECGTGHDDRDALAMCCAPCDETEGESHE